MRRAALARLAQRKSPWRCSQGPAYFWDLFVPFHAGLAGIAETRAETYDVAKWEFSRVAAAVEALEAEGWRVVRRGFSPVSAPPTRGIKAARVPCAHASSLRAAHRRETRDSSLIITSSNITAPCAVGEGRRPDGVRSALS